MVRIALVSRLCLSEAPAYGLTKKRVSYSNIETLFLYNVTYLNKVMKYVFIFTIQIVD